MTWCESGGTGSRAIMLLHGLGATAAVWDGVRRVIDQRAIGRWFAPDLGGHGAIPRIHVAARSRRLVPPNGRRRAVSKLCSVGAPRAQCAIWPRYSPTTKSPSVS